MKKHCKAGHSLIESNVYVTPAGYSRCKECGRNYRKSWKRRNPRKRKNQKLKNEYGITVDQYEAMVESQGGKCAICGSKARLVIDHSHSSGKVRGLLCSLCNTDLGLLGDNLPNLKAACRYLVKS